MIKRILLFIALCFISSHAQSSFSFPDSVPNYTEFPNSRCVDDSGTLPHYGAVRFLSEGVEQCAEFCTNAKSCSGFSFSHQSKDLCELFVLEAHEAEVQALLENFNDGSHSVAWIIDGADNYVTTGRECTEFGTGANCAAWQNYRCYIHVTIEPTVSPSVPPTVTPSDSPSFSPTKSPSLSPSVSPTIDPSHSPSVDPTVGPTDNPSVSPSHSPSHSPTVQPSDNPTVKPSVSPSNDPSKSPTFGPSNSPSRSPTVSPSMSPTVSPSMSPTVVPTDNPSVSPSKSPTFGPSRSPTRSPTLSPSVGPTVSPSDNPTVCPTHGPSHSPTVDPTMSPSHGPSTSPSHSPTVVPTDNPSVSPSKSPTFGPTKSPTVSPSDNPSTSPSHSPTVVPTDNPSVSPSKSPTFGPSRSPTRSPTLSPSVGPSVSPTVSPTDDPSVSPSLSPTVDPTMSPTVSPSDNPSVSPSHGPSTSPSLGPTVSPTVTPTDAPSNSPTVGPSFSPSVDPTANPTDQPSKSPTFGPSNSPTVSPSDNPSVAPTFGPSQSPVFAPTNSPSVTPSKNPTGPPSLYPSDAPSTIPTVSPSDNPTVTPTFGPSTTPSVSPTFGPSVSPTTSIPSRTPSASPTMFPTSSEPTVSPSVSPSTSPTQGPSRTPSQSPTKEPTVSDPTSSPSKSPTFGPSMSPTVVPTDNPSVTPTDGPTVGPSKSPTASPTTDQPTVNPSQAPSFNPSDSPTVVPTHNPSTSPSHGPSTSPSRSPSRSPTMSPSFSPSDSPTVSPTHDPTVMPTDNPSVTPSAGPTMAPTPTNPCSIGDDVIVGSSYVYLVEDSSSFENDVLTLVIQTPAKYRIQRYSFLGASSSASEFVGSGTAYWTKGTKEGSECLTWSTFSATWKQIKENTLMSLDVVSPEDMDFNQYIFNKLTLELEETVTTEVHEIEYNRTVSYEVPWAIGLEQEVELSVEMTMVVPTDIPSVSPSFSPTVLPTQSPSFSPSQSPSFSPSTTPSVSPTFAPSTTPSVSPSFRPTGAPSPKTMDHLFTRYALYKPDALGSSLVDINFTTIVRLPWHVMDGQFYIIDNDDMVKDDTETFKLLSDCVASYTYAAFDGFCVDSTFQYANAVYSQSDGMTLSVCQSICDHETNCEGFDFNADSGFCNIIGVNVQSDWTGRLSDYLDGSTWRFVSNPGGSPTQGSFPFPGDKCYIKGTAGWESQLCEDADQTAPLPDECYCTQEWNLVYNSPNVCDASGWWTLGMLIQSVETGNNLSYETDVWVGLTSACAQVITGALEVCLDDAPCSITAYMDAERTTTTGKFYMTENAYFTATVGASANIADLSVESMTITQEGSETTIPTSDYSAAMTGSATALTNKRFSADLNINLALNAPTFQGTIAGIPSTLSLEIGITYVDGVTRRRRLTVFMPVSDSSSVPMDVQIMVYPKQCTNPDGALGSHTVKTCPQGKSIFVCEESGWKSLKDECPESDMNDVIQVLPDTTTSTPELSANNQNPVIIENSSDKDETSFWQLLTFIALAAVVVVFALRWYCSVRAEEAAQAKHVEWAIEDQEPSWTDTDYSTSNASYYHDTNEDLAMKKVYEQIFTQKYLEASDFSGIEESDV